VRVVLWTAVTPVSLQEPEEIAVALVEVFESDASLAMENAIQECLKQAMSSPDDKSVPLHAVALVLLTTSQCLLQGHKQPTHEALARAELCMRLLSRIATLEPRVCFAHVDKLLSIRTSVQRVGKLGGSQGMLLHDCVLRILLLMACHSGTKHVVRCQVALAVCCSALECILRLIQLPVVHCTEAQPLSDLCRS
jgi:hypothetical protein